MRSIPEVDQRVDPASSGGADAPLAPVVNRLRDEVDGLRRAMHSRSIIEQAKGMLMERYGCGPDEAFDRLARLSQDANIRLADVASALVASSLPAADQAFEARPAGGGAAQRAQQSPPRLATPADLARAACRDPVPGWPRQGSADSEFGARVLAQARRTRTRAEFLAARTPQDLVTTVVQTGLALWPPDVAVLATVDVNGVVAIAGQHGLAPAVAARWRAFPIDLGLPICTTLRTGRVDWLVRRPGASGGSEHRRPRPLGLGISPEWASTALLPLGLGGAGRGALMLVWRAVGEPAPARRREAEALAAGVAAILRRLPHSQPGIVPEANVAYRRTAAMDDPVTAVLDGLLDPVLLCEPVLGTASMLVDFRITHANPATTAQVGRETSYFDGRSFLELYPESLRTGLFEACRMVHTTGAQADLSNLDWRLGGPGLASGGPLDVRITRYRSGVLITCKQSPATSGAQL